MDKITVEQIKDAVGGTLVCGIPGAEVTDVTTDSRTAKPGDVFFPIIGEVHDAHKFIPDVIAKGCTTFVVSDETRIPEGESLNVISVDDTTKAIQELSAWYLNKLNLKKVAVTGSVGKTSTRDMVYYVLSAKYKTGRTQGNFNNQFGLPLTIMSFDSEMEAAVLEMGMDRAGQIHRLVDIARPDVGVITNVGISHIEFLGSREGIHRAKMEVTHFFGPNNTLVINENNDMLDKKTCRGDYHLLSVGSDSEADYIVSNVKDYGEHGIGFDITHNGETYNMTLPVPGEHNAVNAALAIAAGSALGVTLPQAIEGLKKLELTGKRLTIKRSTYYTVIDDTYNAAPESMKSAIRTLMNFEGGRKIAILGGMNELGTDSEQYHMEVGQYAADAHIDLLITIGEKAKGIWKGADKAGFEENIHFDCREDFMASKETYLKDKDVILIKASRSLEFEKIVDCILEQE